MSYPPQPPQQPPYAPQYPAYPPYAGAPDPGQPVQRRPHVAWFVPGMVGVMLALVAAVWGVVQLVDLFRTDAVVPSDGESYQVQLSRAGEDRMLFAPVGAPVPQCRVSGPDGTSMVAPTPVTTSETLTTGGGEWRPFAEFTATSSAVAVQCTSDFGTQVRVGAPLDAGTYLPIGLAFFAVLGFGALGGITLLVVAILFFSRPARQVTG